MKKTLWVFLAFFLALLLSTYSPAHARRTFKGKVGQTRTFTVTPTLGDPWEMQALITGKANIECMRKSYFIVERTGTSSPHDYDIDIVRATSSSLHAYIRLCAEDAPYRFGPVGTTWTYAGGRFERTIEAIEAVTVPAGTFEDCLRIRQKDLNCSPPADDILEWFDLGGLGTIKEIRYNNTVCDSPTVDRTTELKSYTK